MAKATWLEDVTIAPPPDVLKLTLSREEAEVLRIIVGNILGSQFGLRGVASRVYHALVEAGVQRADIHLTGELRLEAK